MVHNGKRLIDLTLSQLDAVFDAALAIIDAQGEPPITNGIECVKPSPTPHHSGKNSPRATQFGKKCVPSWAVECEKDAAIDTYLTIKSEED